MTVSNTHTSDMESLLLIGRDGQLHTSLFNKRDGILIFIITNDLLQGNFNQIIYSNANVYVLVPVNLEITLDLKLRLLQPSLDIRSIETSQNSVKIETKEEI